MVIVVYMQIRLSTTNYGGRERRREAEVNHTADLAQKM